LLIAYKSYKKPQFPIKNNQKTSKSGIFQPFFGLKWVFFGRKWPQKQSKNRLFRAISGVFEGKSVPSVPSVSCVPRYNTAKIKA
jgi:hypothetical protein